MSGPGGEPIEHATPPGNDGGGASAGPGAPVVIRSLGDPSVRAAPPTVPQAFQRKTTWPSVIGIISIVLGSLAAIGGLWNVLGMFMFSMFTSRTASTQAAPTKPGQVDFSAMYAQLGAWAPALALASLVMVAIAVLHVLAGCWLLQRRPTSRAWMIRWAIAKILGAIAMSVVTAMMQSSQFEAIAQSGAASGSNGPPPAAMKSIMTLMGVLSGCGMLLFYCAMPVFVLIWLNRPMIVREVARWTERSSGKAAA